MNKILVTGEIAETGIERLRQAQGIEIDFKPRLPREEILQIIDQYEGLLTRSETTVDRPMLEAGKKLRIVGRGGVGVNNIDLEAATELGVAVTNTPAANTISAAEHTMALMLSCARNLRQATHSLQQEKKWERTDFEGIELLNKTLGVIGLGRIGREVAIRSQAFGMHILAFDPYVTESQAEAFGFELTQDLDEIFKRSDVISPHVPLIESTRDLINAAAIKKMKDGVIILNCARGGVINEDDLLDALRSGKVGAAGIDVFLNEPALESPLLDEPQVTATPHLAASTAEAQAKVGEQIAQQMIDFFEQGSYSNVVNLQMSAPARFHELKAQANLAEAIGSMYGQILSGTVKEVRVEATGELKKELDVMSLTLLKGLLSEYTDDEINYVNASTLAKKRYGIHVSREVLPENVDTNGLGEIFFTSAITDQGTYSLAGMLRPDGSAKLVRINSMEVEANLQGNFIFFMNQDKPGLLGSVCSLLGEKGINIADLRLGRSAKDGVATVLIQLDEPVANEVVKDLAQLSNILEVRQVKL